MDKIDKMCPDDTADPLTRYLPVDSKDSPSWNVEQPRASINGNPSPSDLSARLSNTNDPEDPNPLTDGMLSKSKGLIISDQTTDFLTTGSQSASALCAQSYRESGDGPDTGITKNVDSRDASITHEHHPAIFSVEEPPQVSESHDIVNVRHQSRCVPGKRPLDVNEGSFSLSFPRQGPDQRNDRLVGDDQDSQTLKAALSFPRHGPDQRAIRQKGTDQKPVTTVKAAAHAIKGWS